MKVARRFATSYPTLPATAARVVWSVRLNVVVVSVAALTGSENVAVGAVPVDWPVAPFAGVKPVTVGGVPSTGAAVVKVQVTLATRRTPARSATPVAPPRTRAW